MGRGELILFSAVTGGGKSVALQNITVNFAQNNMNVLYLTFELSEGLTAKRLDSMITNIPNVSIFRQIDKVETIVKQQERHFGCHSDKISKTKHNNK